MTRRQQIMEILKQKETTIKQLADHFEVTRSEVENDLAHSYKLYEKAFFTCTAFHESKKC